MIKRIIMRLFGYRIMVCFGDPAVQDRFAWLKKNIRRGKERTLDAGCGSGAFSFFAAHKGNEVVGISFQKENNDKARERANILKEKKAEFREGDLRKLDEMKELGTYTQIICCETIEHIKGDQKFMKDMSDKLVPGGALLLTTPYKFYKHLPGDNISEVEDGGHMRWGYTHEELEEMCKKAGLRVTQKDYITGVISQKLIWLTRMLGRINPTIAWALVFPLRIFLILDPMITRLFQYPYLSVAIVAEKI